MCAFVNDSTVFDSASGRRADDSLEKQLDNTIAAPHDANPPVRVNSTPTPSVKGDVQSIRYDKEQETRLVELFANQQNQLRNERLVQENAKLKKLVIGLLIFSIAQSTMFGAHVVHTNLSKKVDVQVKNDVENIHEKLDLMSNRVERTSNKNLQHGAAMKVLSSLTSSFNEMEMKRLEQQEDDYYEETKRFRKEL